MAPNSPPSGVFAKELSTWREHINETAPPTAVTVVIDEVYQVFSDPFLDSLLPSVHPQTLTSRAPELGTIIMTIKPIQAFNLSENEDADFLPILCSFLSLLYGIRQTPWLKAPEMKFCRAQLEKFGPQQFTANLRDQLFSQMRMATIPRSSARYALQDNFEIASKIMTRKGTSFEIFRDVPSHPPDLSKQDILRYMNKVGQFDIPLEEINDGNIDAILVLCIGLLGGGRCEAFVIKQVCSLALWCHHFPSSLHFNSHFHPQHCLQGGLSLVVGVAVALPLTPGLAPGLLKAHDLLIARVILPLRHGGMNFTLGLYVETA
ncbi:hypothetical protein FPRO04_06131 [Fusarium proliferatum]|nr:hypothetical protein FPRO04_06131 [Fusarium proliferatum]